jgi:hypothetical protein
MSAMSNPPLPAQGEQASSRPSAAGNPLFWVILAIAVLIGIFVFRGPPRARPAPKPRASGEPDTLPEASPDRAPRGVATTSLSPAEVREAVILRALEKTVDVDYRDCALEYVILELGHKVYLAMMNWEAARSARRLSAGIMKKKCATSCEHFGRIARLYS